MKKNYLLESCCFKSLPGTTIKIILPLLLVLYSYIDALAQKPVFTSTSGQKVLSIQRLADVKDRNPLGSKLKMGREKHRKKIDNNEEKPNATRYDTKVDNDGAIDRHKQQANQALSTATIGVNIDGHQSGASPADPSMAVGISHVVQMINAGGGSSIRIFDKAGNIVVNNMLLSNISGIQGYGDPVVMYDQLANRWLLTEFGTISGGLSPTTLIICVSTGSDPTSGWNVYAYEYPFMPDFPKFAIWNNAYYATTNDFSGGYLGSSIYAFDRAAMLSGAATATVIRTRLTNADNDYFPMAPVCLEGDAEPANGTNGLFMYFQDDAYTADPADADSLFIFELTPNFGNPAASVISPETSMLCAPLNREVCAIGGKCVVQKGTDIDIAAMSWRMSNKVTYRNFSTHEAIVCNITVNKGNGIAGLRWWETRRTGGSSGTWAIYQEATETGTPANNTDSRFLGSINMDVEGNIILAYNVSGVNTYPSVRFTGRNACDPLNTMTLPETSIVAGTWFNAHNRYGDYNTLALDPATKRDFWFSAMYNKAPQWNTRLASMALNGCSTAPQIRFATSAITMNEKVPPQVNGCATYRDVPVTITVDPAPSGPVNVFINVIPGSAQNLVDYTLPGTTSFVLDANQRSGNCIVRIFDDLLHEDPEDFSLSYTIFTNNGNAVPASYNQTCKIFIADDDGLPTAAKPIISTLPFDSLIAVGNAPILANATVKNRIVQCLYTADELRNIGFAPGYITSIGLNVLVKHSTLPFKNFRISLANTSNLNASTIAFPVYEKFYAAAYNTAPGINTFPFSGNGFYWNGTDNLAIQYCYDLDALNGGVNDEIEGLNYDPYNNNNFFARRIGFKNATTTLNCAYTILEATAITLPRIRIAGFVNTTSIESQLNDSVVAYVRAGGEHYFYSSQDHQLMVSLTEVTSEMGCMKAKVTGAGTDWKYFNDGYRSAKVIDLKPLLSAPNVTYRGALYFNLEELDSRLPGAFKVVKTNAATADEATSLNSTFEFPQITDFGNFKGVKVGLEGYSKFFLIESTTNLPVPQTFTFTGNGNWETAANWVGNSMPPNNLPWGKEILINPAGSGECVLNHYQFIGRGGRIRVAAGKKFIINGLLQLYKDP
ncbi:MAG: hypothetical protein V4722_22200 [Bacteroidota bacterium]